MLCGRSRELCQSCTMRVTSTRTVSVCTVGSVSWRMNVASPVSGDLAPRSPTTARAWSARRIVRQPDDRSDRGQLQRGADDRGRVEEARRQPEPDQGPRGRLAAHREQRIVRHDRVLGHEGVEGRRRGSAIWLRTEPVSGTSTVT